MGDYFLYEWYDDRIVRNEYGLKRAEKRFDGVLPGSVLKDSPLQWAKALAGPTDLRTHEISLFLQPCRAYGT